MRIVIDLQGAQTESRFRGIGRYSLSLVQSLVRNRGDHEIFIALNGLFPHTIEPIRAALNGQLPQENILVWHAPGPVRECESGNKWRREAAERIREAFLSSLRPDIVFITSLFEGYEDDAVTSVAVFDQNVTTVVMLYDLIPFQNPDQYLHSNPSYEEYYLRKMEYLKRACGWFTISDFSANEGREVAGLRGDMIFNISAACDMRFRRIDYSPEARSIFCRCYKINRPFVLYAGGADTRKNLPRLIRAYGLLSSELRKSHHMVLAGKIADYEICALQDIAKSAGLGEDDLIFTGYVSDDDLVRLYNSCKLFVYPSWHEGFGLPALEAMSCGAPLIAANSSSLPEVIGLNDAMFDPFSEDAIAGKISDVLTNDSFRKELIRHGYDQAGKFSWNECAKRAFVAIERIHSDRKKDQEVLPPISRPKLAYISPLPPSRSGISDYSAELLPELVPYYDIEVIVDQQDVSDPWIKASLPIRTVDWFINHSGSYDRILYHMGNSPFHQHMFYLLNHFAGVVVMHDFFYSSVKEYLDITGFIPGAWTRELYRSHGYVAVFERFHKADPSDVKFKYPCNFGVICNAVGIIVHSVYSVQLGEDWYGDVLQDSWAVIPHLRSSQLGEEKTTSRDNLGLGHDDFIICSFGLLSPTKQNHRLLKAWLNSSLAKDPRSRLIFVGENDGGDYGRQILDEISSSGFGNRICITGWVDADYFHNYLAAADMAVQLRTMSRGETSGTILDCMNYSLPTIVNANGSIAELPQDAVCMLPDAFDDAELIEALETLWLDAEWRQALGARAREVILTRHAPRACAEQYSRAIESFYASAKNGTRSLVDVMARLELVPDNDAAIMAIASAISQNMPPKRPAKQLLVDISGLVQKDLKTGIERVVRGILDELLQNPPVGYRVEPVYATADCQGYRYAREFTLRLLGCHNGGLEDDPIDAYPGDLFLGLELQSQIIPIQLGYLEALRHRGIAVDFIVYDILPILMPKNFPKGTDEIHAKWLNAIAQFDGALCISKAVANDIMGWLNANGPKRFRPIKISYFHLGADVDNSVPTRGLPDDVSQVLAQLAARPSFLMVGTVEPRKGYLQIIDAFERLWKQGYEINLIIVGNEGWKGMPDGMRRTIPEIVGRLRSHSEKGKKLFWLEGISDEYLEKVYAACTCLIAASEGEGFCLPLIEAAQHKLPIMARDIAVFHEVAGDYVYYFHGMDPDDLAAAIREWLKLYQSGCHPVSDGMPWLTWKQSTQQLLDVILKDSWETEWMPQRPDE
jgi:glycosyltransferase involved in cell wall biosynthesis